MEKSFVKWAPELNYGSSLHMVPLLLFINSQIARFMWPSWGPHGSCWSQLGPMYLAIRVPSQWAQSAPLWSCWYRSWWCLPGVVIKSRSIARTISWWQHVNNFDITLIARFVGPTWGPPGADRAQVGPKFGPTNFVMWEDNKWNFNFASECYEILICPWAILIGVI